ncbi:hypothetical protein PRIC1_008603 [Phytophthora ramorum]
MELPEDVYEDELIDAFDAPQVEGLAPTKTPSSSPHRTSLSSERPMRPSVQEFQTTGLYPTFDEAPKVSEAAATESRTKHNRQDDKLEVKGVQQYVAPSPVHGEEWMSAEELQRQRQQIEGQMKVYQKRFDHVAQALAGETPHQIEERKKREEERLERQEKRYEAVETRLQHQIERREDREERRARIQARHHRASRSPSPSNDCEQMNEDELAGGSTGVQKTEHE